MTYRWRIRWLSNIFRKPLPFPLDEIERIGQPNDGFERRFAGRLDQEVDAETKKEEVRNPTCEEGWHDFSYGEDLRGSERNIVSD